MHIPVLLNEILRHLDPKPNQNFIDATVGDGGHAAAILKKTSPAGKLLAIDRDSDSIIRARSKLREFENRVIFINDSFGNLERIVKENNFDFASGILFSLTILSKLPKESFIKITLFSNSLNLLLARIIESESRSMANNLPAGDVFFKIAAACPPSPTVASIKF